MHNSLNLINKTKIFVIFRPVYNGQEFGQPGSSKQQTLKQSLMGPRIMDRDEDNQSPDSLDHSVEPCHIVPTTTIL